jgi:DNA-binding transcriptional ArsR family regulator
VTIFAAPAPAPQPVSEDVIYDALSFPTRRRVLRVLADGTGRTAVQLSGGGPKEQDTLLKNLNVLRNAGLLRTEPNPANKRRQLYFLNPAIKVTKTDTGTEMDFGCCVMRF